MNPLYRALVSAAVAVAYVSVGLYTGRESQLLLLAVASFLASFTLLTPDEELKASNNSVFDIILSPKIINAAVSIGLVTMLLSLIA